jgi:predicted  nucleic acid-binding Zn-ribbon protein
MSQPFKLFRLQQIDSLLDKTQAKLKEIDRLINDNLELRMAEQRLERAQREKYEAEKKLRTAEENVRQQRLKIERSQAALYGGKVINPKELQDLQQESEALQRYLGTLEDMQLEAMLELDEIESSFRNAEKNMAETDEQVAEQKQLLSVEQSKLTHELEVNEAARNTAADNIDTADLQLYETLRKQKNGIAVARIIEKTCAACGSTLTASTFSSAQVPNKITRCDSCGRIFYAG